jgi:ferredoxin-fold anticodon binding domain-containing protein
MKECYAVILFKDGSNCLAKCKLEGDLPFSEDEMRNWLIEQAATPVADVKFVSVQEITIPHT